MAKEKQEDHNWEDEVDAERLWSTLENIRDEINGLTTAFTKFQENVEGRLNRIDEKYDELKAEQDQARGSRAKAFARIDKMSDDLKDRFHEMEHRIDEVELVPARKALARDEDTGETIRREVIKRLTNLGVGLVLILIFLFGSRMVLQPFTAVLPKSAAEVVEEVLP